MADALESSARKAHAVLGSVSRSHLLPRTLKSHGIPSEQIWLPIDTKIKELIARTRSPKIDFGDTRHYVPDIVDGHDGPFYYARIFLYVVVTDTAKSSKDRVATINRRLSRYIQNLKLAHDALNEVIPQPADRDDLFRVHLGLPNLGPNGYSKAFKAIRKRVDRNLDALTIARASLKNLEKRVARQIESLAIRKSSRGRIPNYWKTQFVIGIARLWLNITLCPPSTSPQSAFADFVRACWASIAEDVPEESFDSVIRHLDVERLTLQIRPLRA